MYFNMNQNIYSSQAKNKQEHLTQWSNIVCIVDELIEFKLWFDLKSKSK